MTGAALTLGIIGAVLGAASFGWNLAAFFLAAGRVRVVLRGGWTNGTDWASIPLASFGKDHGTNPLDHPILVIEVMNTGRLPVTVSQCAIEIGTVRYGELRQPRNPKTPLRLEVGDQATWFFDVGDVLEVADLAAKQVGTNASVRGLAVAGAGKVRRSEERTTPAMLHNLVPM